MLKTGLLSDAALWVSLAIGTTSLGCAASRSPRPSEGPSSVSQSRLLNASPSSHATSSAASPDPSASPSVAAGGAPAPSAPVPPYRYDCEVVVSSEDANYERHHEYAFDNQTTQVQLSDVQSWAAYDPSDLTKAVDPKLATQHAAEKNFDGHTISLAVAQKWDDVQQKFEDEFDVTATVSLNVHDDQQRSDIVSTSLAQLSDPGVSSTATFRSYQQDDFNKDFESLSVTMNCVKK